VVSESSVFQREIFSVLTSIKFSLTSNQSTPGNAFFLGHSHFLLYKYILLGSTGVEVRLLFSVASGFSDKGNSFLTSTVMQHLENRENYERTSGI
jgi:hypothetical protein